MTTQTLSDILGEIEVDFIQEARQPVHKKTIWLKWTAMASCICLVSVLAVVNTDLSGQSPTPSDPSLQPVQSDLDLSFEVTQTEAPVLRWLPIFNQATYTLDVGRICIPGYFTEALSDAELAAVTPESNHLFTDCFGYAGFDATGGLIDVQLSVTTAMSENTVHISISKGDAGCGYMTDGDPITSVCGNVEYTLYEWHDPNKSVTLSADTVINGCYFAFTMESDTQALIQAKDDFTQVLSCFAVYADGSPNLDAVTATEIPEWFDNTLNHQEAMNDPSYGVYVLPSAPAGFTEESIRRYKSQTEDYLSGLWSRGYDELYWKVYTLGDAEKDRLTGIDEKENYDLSLYPIPRASSVPDHLREIVDNPIFTVEEFTMDAVWARAYTVGDAGDSAGWRMNFSVLYGDIVVEVRAKGLDPEWVYLQLIKLTDLRRD